MSIYKHYQPLMMDGEDGSKIFRTYMKVQDGLYSIYFGDEFKREFTDETLPDVVKVIVGIVNAYDWDSIHLRSNAIDTDEEAIVWRFSDHYPPVLFDIGWRYKEHYCIVLSKQEFDDMRGGCLTKVSNMTLSEHDADMGRRLREIVWGADAT